jgi:hypothetical protein
MARFGEAKRASDIYKERQQERTRLYGANFWGSAERLQLALLELRADIKELLNRSRTVGVSTVEQHKIEVGSN